MLVSSLRLSKGLLKPLLTYFVTTCTSTLKHACLHSVLIDTRAIDRILDLSDVEPAPWCCKGGGVYIHTGANIGSKLVGTNSEAVINCCGQRFCD